MPRLSPSIFESSISPKLTAVRPVQIANLPTWVAIQQTGLPAYSQNGTTWQEAEGFQAKGAALCAVAHGEGRFVAVGNQISISTDGIHWTTKVHLTCNPLQAVAQTNDLWICVGENGRKMFSNDQGENWTDGMTWYPGHYRSIAVGNNTFVAVGETLNGKGFINRTNDGQKWGGEQLVDTALLDVAFGSGRFVATDARGHSLTSEDGLNWTTHIIKRGLVFHKIRHVNGVFLTSSSRGKYYWSIDGEQWFEEQGFLPRTVMYAGGLYIGSSRAGRYFIANGLDQWQQNKANPFRFIDFAYGDHRSGVSHHQGSENLFIQAK